MSNPAFPISGKSFLVTSGDFGENGSELAVRTTMDSGRIKVRKRFTTVPSFLAGTLGSLTSAQVDTLMTFWKTTCAGGSIPFDWAHPRTKVTTAFLFTQRPTIQQFDSGTNTYYKAQLNLQIV